MYLCYYTGCLKIREFRIRSVVGGHFSSPNREIKKKIGTPPTKIHWPEGPLFALRFLQIQAEKFSVYYLLLYRCPENGALPMHYCVQEVYHKREKNVKKILLGLVFADLAVFESGT
jgi:hypothetical protein